MGEWFAVRNTLVSPPTILYVRFKGERLHAVSSESTAGRLEYLYYSAVATFGEGGHMDASQ